MAEGWKSTTGSSTAGSWRARCGIAAAVVILSLNAAWAENTLDMAPDPDQSRAEYEQISKEISLSSERLAKLAADIAAVKKDHASITAALIQSAMTEQKLGQDIEDIGAKLEGLKTQQQKIRASLMARRDVLAEVLGALQRMGLNPPPAILVKPEDALSSVRSAILLGAVVPELRQQTDRLLADLKEQTRVTASIEAERARLTAAVGEQTAEKKRLGMLLEAKQKLEADTQAQLSAERQHSEALAAKASSLKELIASLEAQAERNRKAADAAKAAEAGQAGGDKAGGDKAGRDKAGGDMTASLPVPEANRLAAAAPFSALQGQIALPVIGRIKRRFGAEDGNGAVMLGDMVATQSGAIVTAPADGNVLYAGPFRSYGQLLILNAGDGYHVVLAGMSRISVATGQSVLAGEPVGAMGEARVASTSASKNGNATPELYVEFRKDGKPVDPAPWWADRFSGRT
ncbi:MULTISPECIES: murein hydrolase activator EnvC family protein [unclassified Mesorhizobium]|uniref:murein hydrolase activator EnvC family protein n=1 Tax=unclassified Mesorhizobium TaxID=325217 RepID=UPI001129DEEC|nr:MULTISPECIES: murein hydrolase activator EnvC [unclassified Mesorhizobium]TPJ50216.1 murein hydrolase activator EnvC [Mesorhizobium sp. B2-6-6]MBZ9700267.1 murein hydrolase activator EnvC [Mesorhizobium sp. CO1-1-3]MBZ9950046.1 murein hydrolase activator EnvC [Mesorhizobium sp. BR1-1-11]MCA0001775.1 murein hydrolase activator EnvC [Mesorhizobium sp. B264B2A]MCA0007882.1 murein hydrolase activator EnvC [Mesorhizobium sp. B264B1B]